MTNAELIDLLQTRPPDQIVMIEAESDYYHVVCTSNQMVAWVLPDTRSQLVTVISGSDDYQEDE